MSIGFVSIATGYDEALVVSPRNGCDTVMVNESIYAEVVGADYIQSTVCFVQDMLSARLQIHLHPLNVVPFVGALGRCS